MAVLADKCPEIQVTVVDINEEKIIAWNSENLKKLPIYEPGLSLLIKKNRNKNLFFSRKINENISDEIDWYLVMQQAFKKKYPLGKADSLKDVIKQKRFLANRGFSFEEIESVFD